MSECIVSQPRDYPEYLEILRSGSGRPRPLGGGTDLLLQMRRGEVVCDHLVSLERMRWDEVFVEGDTVRLGSFLTIAALGDHPLLRERVPFLCEAAGLLGSRQIRNVATLGGNLCNAAPSAETAPPLLALDARAKIQGPDGLRTVPLREFFTGPGTTVLEEEELLRWVEFSLPASPWHATYTKISPRRAMDIAVVGVAVLLSQDPGNGRVRTARIALGAVGPTPLRADAAEALLEDRVPDPERLEEAARESARTARCITDIRATARYRIAMVHGSVAGGLRECWQALSGQKGAIR